MLRSQAAPTGPAPLLCSRPLFLPRRRRAVLLSPCPACPWKDAGCSWRGHQPWRQGRWQEGALGTCSSLPARRVPPAGPREGPVGRAESRPVELPWASKASGPAPGVPPACTRSKGWALSLPCSPACSVPFGAGTAWLGGPAALPVLLQVHFCALWEALAAPWLKEAETHGNFNPLWEQPQSPAGRGSTCGLPALSCQGRSVTVRRSHPGPFAFSAASRFPAQPGAALHPCHNPRFFLKHCSLFPDPLSATSVLFSTKHSLAPQPRGKASAGHGQKKIKK